LNKTLFFIALLGLMQVVLASDLDREKRLADEIVRGGLIDGEPVFLETKEHSFLTIYTETENTPKNEAVVIIHGRGLNPNEKNVAYPLRTQLAEQGWDTLSIQMPVLAKGSGFNDYSQILPEAAPRIEQSIQFLKERKYKKIHLIAHSCGSQMVMSWVEKKGFNGFNSLTVISMGTENYRDQSGQSWPLNKVKVPILDIYGSKDFIAENAPKRLKLIKKAANAESEQLMILNAEHMFENHSHELVNSISTWLNGLSN